MTIIFILQLVGGILAFSFQDELGVILKNQMEDQMRLYDDPEGGDLARNTWDKLQIDVKLSLNYYLVRHADFFN
jgi:hypothetical protein